VSLELLLSAADVVLFLLLVRLIWHENEKERRKQR
jgi:hypothetical protein